MMMQFGEDFQKAKTRWLFEAISTVSLGKVLLIVIALVAAHLVLQNLSAFLFMSLFKTQGMMANTEDLTSLVYKAAVVGMLPASIVSAFLAFKVSKYLDQNHHTMLPLHWPKLGWLGWLTVLGAFVATMYAAFIGTFTVLGIDPATYTPGGGGAGDNSNSSGLVEKTLADLADEPLLFAITFPGIALGVPLAEELLFRGILFTAIAKSRLGKWGAVLITAVLFAMMHAMAAPWLFVWVIFLMAILLGLLLLRFGSLWVPIICHMVWNSLNSVMLIIGANAS